MLSQLPVLWFAFAWPASFIFLVQGLTTTTTKNAPSDRSLRTSISISDALRERSSPDKLDLETDFFDPSTGLYSEGVWHNALLGIASLEQEQQQRLTIPASTLQLAESLYRYSWDGISFRRRAWSGNWDHSTLLGKNCKKLPAQANYYRESSEHRCVQHGMALVLWSKLARKQREQLQQERKGVNNQLSILHRQQSEIAQQFVQEFWDSKALRWNTVSRTQGGGTRERLSASAGTPAQNVDDKQKNQPYYRAVDQAIAILACCEHLKCLADSAAEGGDATIDKEVNRIKEIIQLTCHEVLAPPTDGFGYGEVETDAKSYLGLNRNRNFWHDGWVLLSLVHARDYLWPNDNDRGQAPLMSMWKGLVQLYAHENASFVTNNDSSFDGTIWHWPTSLKDPDQNVRYSGDNALAYAICRKLSVSVPTNDGGQLFQFVMRLQDQGEMNPLVSVADVYPQVRLHPNSELATLLVWP